MFVTNCQERMIKKEEAVDVMFAWDGRFLVGAKVKSVIYCNSIEFQFTYCDFDLLW